MKTLYLTAALVAFSATGVLAQEHNCGDAVTCNNGSINKDNISQDIISNDNQYAPDSATSNATVGDVIAQGGTGGNSTATGNSSHNDNKSSANNNGTVTGNQSFNGSFTGGPQSQEQVQGDLSQQMGDQTANTTGGTANTTGGTANTNSGNINAGGNKSHAQGGAGGKSVSQATGGKATGGASHSGGNSLRGGNTNVDASQRTTIRQSAAAATGTNMQAYGQQNCFGDTNPSGGFQLGVQTIGGGAYASSHKQSNICAAMAILGPQGAVAYMAKQDPYIGQFIAANGSITLPNGQVIESKSHRAARLKAEAQQVRAMAAQPTRQVVRCPQGSNWDGKGCWMPKRR